MKENEILKEEELKGEVKEGVEAVVIDNGLKDQAAIIKEYEDTLGY